MHRNELGLRATHDQRGFWAGFGKSRRSGKNPWQIFLVSSVTLGLLVACAVVPVKEPAELVAVRAKERWQALIERDLARAYTFLSEGTRLAISLERYKSSIKPGIWRKVEVDAVQCQESVCKVRLSVTYDHERVKGVTTPLSENWLIENGNAWFVLTN